VTQEDLMEWLSQTNVPSADPVVLRENVNATLQILPKTDPCHKYLVQLSSVINSHQDPTSGLNEYIAVYQSNHEPLPYGTQLALEYRRVADELPESEWLTEFYDKALEAVDLSEGGYPKKCVEILDNLRLRLTEVWTNYRGIQVMKEDVSAETVVCHLLLQDGVEAWLHALDQLTSADQGKGSFDEALLTAERANRLLVSSQKLTSWLSSGRSSLAESFGE
jgi:hypothetical protein